MKKQWENMGRKAAGMRISVKGLLTGRPAIDKLITDGYAKGLKALERKKPKKAELLPCATCPWRKDKGAGTIPRYNHEKACNLQNTVGEGDDFRPIMACHHSSEHDNYACNGYLAIEGDSNINVRMEVACGRMHPPALVYEACQAAGIELHASYAEMMEKLSK